ncbi:MAG: dTDP-4-dehydrorhamnose reductase [Rhodospirillaceae bacterium]|jgi:dTDP-4-dehydrorhamnose reductase|nr:dTDP-4-dehydrorhamnose reductase [Rhodospirillaceae bacterium]
MSRILVIGRRGQVARALAESSWPQSLSVIVRGRESLDLGEPAAVARQVVKESPDLVINAAAYTAVDQAEQERDAAFAINRDGPAALAAACAKIGTALLHVSTDYVFDGTKAGPYTEDDPVNPLSVYGASKEAGEQAIRAILPAHLILRSSWVYAPDGRNFVRTMLRLARECEEVRVVDDQRGSPTAAVDIAAALIAAAERILAGGRDFGTFHFCGEGATSWHGFAQAIFELSQGPRPRLLAVPSSAYPTPTHRPANSVLDCGKFQRTYGISARPWRESLVQCLAEIEEATP